MDGSTFGHAFKEPSGHLGRQPEATVGGRIRRDDALVKAHGRRAAVALEALEIFHERAYERRSFRLRVNADFDIVRERASARTDITAVQIGTMIEVPMPNRISPGLGAIAGTTAGNTARGHQFIATIEVNALLIEFYDTEGLGGGELCRLVLGRMKPVLASFLEKRIHAGHILRTRRGSDLGSDLGFQHRRWLARLIFCGGAGNAKKEGNERKQEKRLHSPIILRFWGTARTGVSEILTKCSPQDRPAPPPAKIGETSAACPLLSARATRRDQKNAPSHRRPFRGHPPSRR